MTSERDKLSDPGPSTEEGGKVSFLHPFFLLIHVHMVRREAPKDEEEEREIGTGEGWIGERDRRDTASLVFPSTVISLGYVAYSQVLVNSNPFCHRRNRVNEGNRENGQVLPFVSLSLLSSF